MLLQNSLLSLIILLHPHLSKNHAFYVKFKRTNTKNHRILLDVNLFKLMNVTDLTSLCFTKM